MKKILGVVLSLGLVIGLAGCSSQATATPAPTETAAPEPIKMGRIDAAAHGKNAVTIAAVAVQGDKIVGVSIDEYQFMPADKAQGLPNTEGLAANYKDPAKVLASKIVNSEYYSNSMKEKAGSTVAYVDNFNAIAEFAEGKTISELEGILSSTPAEKMPVDTVTGSTLADTAGYLQAIVDAAKAAK